jgi:phospholipid/cholesterol/gamma-HCH transport system substrate-binding protein
METDKHYFLVGLFIIGTAAVAALFAVWLADGGRRDDVLYRIHFTEPVSGLSMGDPVKFQGVDVGAVESMTLDPEDPRRVQVDVRLRKETPVKTDTRATLELKGITGAVLIQLQGGSPQAPSLLAATPKDQVPEIPAVKSSLSIFLEELPRTVKKLSALSDDAKKVVADAGELTAKVKENPSLLLFSPKKKKEPKP